VNPLIGYVVAGALAVILVVLLVIRSKKKS